MKSFSFLLLSAALTAPAVAAPGFQAEAGVSYFDLRNTGHEAGSAVLGVDEPEEFVPYIAGRYAFNERFSLRLSYRYLSDVATVTTLGSPPGSPLQIIVYRHAEDDVHLLNLAPEFNWKLGTRLTLSLAPQLNWVKSRGVVAYSTTDPTVLLIGPQRRRDDGFTFGGATQLSWTLGPRTAVTVGYEYMDLDPSFDREAHVISAGIRWTF